MHIPCISNYAITCKLYFMYLLVEMGFIWYQIIIRYQTQLIWLFVELKIFSSCSGKFRLNRNKLTTCIPAYCKYIGQVHKPVISSYRYTTAAANSRFVCACTCWPEQIILPASICGWLWTATVHRLLNVYQHPPDLYAQLDTTSVHKQSSRQNFKV